MNPKDRQIFEKFTKQLRLHIPTAKVIAFGSRARGNSCNDSDFDICIVSDNADAAINDIVRNIAWEVGYENDRIITTTIFDSYQFEHGAMSESTLVDNIRIEGIAA